MGTPQTLDDFDLPLLRLPSQVPAFLYIEVEGTALQLPQRIARILELYGLEVRVVEQKEQGEEAQNGGSRTREPPFLEFTFDE